MSLAEKYGQTYIHKIQKIEIPLPASTLIEKECRDIMLPAIKLALPRSGASVNMSTEISNGHNTSGGSGILDIFHYQGTPRTFMIIEHRYRNT